ncbi:MAG: hypothetical protein ACFFG0_03810 [Candidatus Thorarchaeota archaeon]
MIQVKPVEPKLDQKTTDYMNSLKDFDLKNSKISKKEVDSFIKHFTKDNETYASFIAITDRLERSNNIFRVLTAIHFKAIQTNEEYKKLFSEASKYPEKLDETLDGTDELPLLIAERLNWNKENLGR